jgi:glutamine amidotransferase
MKKISIGIVDYGMGNHSSIVNSLRDLGFRVKVSNQKLELDTVDVILLPGVGAFGLAMENIIKLGLDDYIKNAVNHDKPLIGICLGMQLMTESSSEHGLTNGLELIPGKIISFPNNQSHIGWNDINLKKSNSSWLNESDRTVYFNHSYYYDGPDLYKAATTHYAFPFASIIKHKNSIGLQFHPEKSQATGKFILKKIITSLLDD